MPPERFALVRVAQLLWGPGPKPYVIPASDGRPLETAALSPEECAAVGLIQVEQRGWREIDPEIEQAEAPVFSIEEGRPFETWSYRFTPGARAAMRRKIDEQAEALRTRFMGIGCGQVMEHDQAYREALAVLALAPETPIVPGQFPYLEADIAVTALPGAGRAVDTTREAAAVVIGARELCLRSGAMIRQRRLRAKAAIGAAATDAEALRAYDAAWRGL